jgi:tetratricopeptide (TPR) repeat protein
MTLVLVVHALTILAGTPASAAQDSVAAGRVHLRDGRLADALGAFRAAASLDSTNASAWNGMGSVLNQTERYREALEAADRAVRLDPRHAGYRFNRGLVYAELGRFREAIAEYDSALAWRPGLAPALTERGTARASLGERDAARTDWDRALALDSAYVWTRFYRGQFAIVAGDFAAAAADLDVVADREALLSAHLWRWVARRGSGRAVPGLPASTMTGWPGPIAAFLAGRITADQLASEAHRARLALDERRQATAHYFIGQKQLFDGNRRAARQSLERAVAFSGPRFADRIAAEEALRRLDASSP